MLGHAIYLCLAILAFCSLSAIWCQNSSLEDILRTENVTYQYFTWNQTLVNARNESDDVDNAVPELAMPEPKYLIDLDPVSLEALRGVVTSYLTDLVYEGLIKTNASLVDTAQNFSSCLQIIHQSKDDCFECINNRCQFRADECADIDGESPEIDPTEPEPEIDLTDKIKCVVSPPLCAVERLDEKVAKEIKRGGRNIARNVDKAGDLFGEALKGIGDGAKDLAKGVEKGLKNIGKVVGGAAQDLGEGLEDAGKDIERAVKDVLKDAGDTLKKNAESVVEDAKDVVENVGNGLKNTGKAVGHVAKGISKNIGRELENTKKAVKNILKGVGDGIENAGKNIGNAAKHTIMNPVKDVIKSVGRLIPPVKIRLPKVHLPRIRVPRIRLPRISRGWRRRRRSSEPTCKELTDDTASACRFYQTRCDVCSLFGQLDSEQSIDDMLEEICGEDILETYENLNTLANRLSTLIELYDVGDVFYLESLSFDPISYEGDGYKVVHVTFDSLNQTSGFYLQHSTLPHAAQIAGPIIAEEIYKNLLDNYSRFKKEG